MESRQLLAVLTVTTVADSVNPSDGLVSLREAILESDQLPGHDTIRFDPALTNESSATIRLSDDSLMVRSSITIEGPGANLLTIDGGDGTDQQFNTSDGFNVFIIDDEDDASQSVVELSGVTITGGDARGNDYNSGGAIFTRENLTLKGVHLTGNASNVGGGLASGWPTVDSVVHVIDSTVSGNAASLGGGIYHIGALYVLNSTVSGNDASNASGQNGRAGGIGVQGTLYVDHSTITENTSIARGGGISWGGLPDDTVSINHSIVSGNHSQERANLDDTLIGIGQGESGRFQGDHNLIGMGLRTPGDHVILSDEPLLGPLTDEGGSTPSHAPLANSPVIDAGDPTVDGSTIPFDQRGDGFPRIQDGDANGTSIIDIGAIEFPMRVNQQPNFSMGDAPRVLEDAGFVSVPGFATFDPGDPDETDQVVLGYHVSNLQSPDLFSVQPTIDNAGSLTFTLNDDAFGVATLDVVVQDNGGTANGGIDTSETQRLTITVVPVNDAPSFSIGELPPVANGVGSQRVNGFVSSVDLGAENESSQSILGYTVTVIETQGDDGGNFFQSLPEIDNRGNLTFWVHDDILSGSAKLAVVAQDNGGTLDGGSDISQPQSFVLSVVPTDFGDAPDTFPVTRTQGGAQHISGTLHLGATVDSELDGTPSTDADADGGDDGVYPIASMLTVTGSATTSSFEIVASEPGRLDAWVDFTADGDWNDAGERIAFNTLLSEGSNTLSFTVPNMAVPGELAARFRISSAGVLSATGLAPDGEVEDYMTVMLDSGVSPEVRVDTIDPRTSITLQDTTLVVRDSTTDLFAAPIDQLTALRVQGTESDDIIELDVRSLSLPEPVSIDAGLGHDTLLITAGDGQIDLTTDEDVNVANVALIDLGEDHLNSLALDLSAVHSLSPLTDPIRVTGGQGDEIRFDDFADWRMGPSAIIDGVFWRSAIHVESEDGRVDVDLPLPWHNFVLANDVNNSGTLSPTDALAIINELARTSFFDTSTNQLVDPVNLSQFPDLYIDTNGDGLLTPRDALSVINAIALTEAGPLGETPTNVERPAGFGIIQNRNAEPAEMPVTEITFLTDLYFVDSMGQSTSPVSIWQAESRNVALNPLSLEHAELSIAAVDQSLIELDLKVLAQSMP